MNIWLGGTFSVMVAKNFGPCPDTTQLVHLYNRPCFLTKFSFSRRFCGLCLQTMGLGPLINKY